MLPGTCASSSSASQILDINSMHIPVKTSGKDLYSSNSLFFDNSMSAYNTHFDVAKHQVWKTQFQLVYLGNIFTSRWSYFTKYTETIQRKHRVSLHQPLPASALISQDPAYLLFAEFLSHAHSCPNNSAFISSTLYF